MRLLVAIALLCVAHTALAISLYPIAPIGPIAGGGGGGYYNGGGGIDSGYGNGGYLNSGGMNSGIYDNANTDYRRVEEGHSSRNFGDFNNMGHTNMGGGGGGYHRGGGGMSAGGGGGRGIIG